MVEGDLHQKNLFLITIMSAYPFQDVSNSLPRQPTIQLGFQLIAIPPTGVSAQASMLLVSSCPPVVRVLEF
jgi:hypothetical protein